MLRCTEEKLEVHRFHPRTTKRLVTVNTLEHMPTEIPLVFDVYADDSSAGGFALIDRISQPMKGTGVIDHALRSAEPVEILRAVTYRASWLGQKHDCQRPQEAALRPRSAHPFA